MSQAPFYLQNKLLQTTGSRNGLPLCRFVTLMLLKTVISWWGGGTDCPHQLKDSDGFKHDRLAIEAD